MNKTIHLFPELKKPKRKPARIMAKVRDIGIECGLFECKCGWNSGWIDVSGWTITKCKNGVECEKCNEVTK